MRELGAEKAVVGPGGKFQMASRRKTASGPETHVTEPTDDSGGFHDAERSSYHVS